MGPLVIRSYSAGSMVVLSVFVRAVPCVATLPCGHSLIVAG
jgi:hypothetical protein